MEIKDPTKCISIHAKDNKGSDDQTIYKTHKKTYGDKERTLKKNKIK